MPTSFSDPLPNDMERGNTCCFTGHRIIPTQGREIIISELDSMITRLSECGYKYFLCGGALGFDMLAEKKVLELEEKLGNIKLILALPHLAQTEKWGKGDNSLSAIRDYHEIKARAAAVVYLSDEYTPTCMKERNQFMIDNSSFCIAYSKNRPRSGSAQTVRMAEKAGITVYNIASEIEKKEKRAF